VEQPTDWILDGLPVGVWVGAVPDGRVAYTNRRFAEILGMGAVSESRIGDVPVTYRVFDRAGHPYPVERLPFSQALATGRTVIVDDMVIERPDGAHVDVRAYGIPVRDKAERITHVIVAFLDISREARAEHERETIEARLRFAVDHAPIVIWAIDNDGVVTLSEGAGLSALGVRSGELVGQSLFELYKDHPAIPGYIRRGLAGEALVYTVSVGQAAYDTWLTPLRDSSGAMTGVLGLSNDVSEVRRLQAKVVQDDRVRAMGTLAASVAHEINNPLTYILGGLSGLERGLQRLRDLPGADDLVRAAALGLVDELGPVRRGVERIATVTRDLKTFSRPDDTRLEPVDLRGVVEAALKLSRKEIEARARLRLSLDIVPPVRGNEARLVQVAMNLVMNAAQSLAEGDPARDEVTVATRGEGDSVVLEVSDTGAGVAPADRDRIFEPFVTTKPIGEGTGLGLFVCRNVVRGLGGDVTVHDRPGGGALFRVTLPAATAAAAEPASVSPAPATTGHVVVIDDDPLVCATLVGQLEHGGFHAKGITEPRTAVAALMAGEPFDLAYCDLMMDGTTGMDIAAEIEARDPERARRLVFMTGGAFLPRAADFMAAQPERCVEKPFDVVSETRRRLARTR
jgi:signal transduction histidine kinase/CheY-like chemotaxis protein